jgi:hypothetical protein
MRRYHTRSYGSSGSALAVALYCILVIVILTFRPPTNNVQLVLSSVEASSIQARIPIAVDTLELAPPITTNDEEGSTDQFLDYLTSEDGMMNLEDLLELRLRRRRNKA